MLLIVFIAAVVMIGIVLVVMSSFKSTKWRPGTNERDAVSIENPDASGDYDGSPSISEPVTPSAHHSALLSHHAVSETSAYTHAGVDAGAASHDGGGSFDSGGSDGGGDGGGGD